MVPFYVGRLFGAITHAHGYLIAREDGLCLALHDGRIEGSVLDEETESVFLDWHQLGELNARHGRMASTVTIPLKTAASDPRLPGRRKDRLELQVQSRDRDALETLLERAAELRLGHRDPDVDQILDDVDGFLRNL